MDAKKFYYLLVATVIVLGFGLIASGYVANQILSSKSAELSKLKAESQVTEQLQDTLKQNKADIEKYSELNEIAKTIVPQDKNQAQAVGEIVKMANESGIGTLTSITFPASTLGGVGASSNASLTQLTPVKGISGVYILPITITLDSTRSVPYSQFITFLQKLENNRRTSQVSQINLQPNANNPNYVSFTLTVNGYIKP